MADGTHIEWTDATWNIINGCSVLSPGCTNCYAMKLAGTRLKRHPSRAGLTRDTKAGPVWTGEVRFHEPALLQPLKWQRPRKIFVCAHGDLFHENVPDEWLDRVFAVMALAQQHVFQVLTKRPERMRDYLLADRRDEMNSHAGTMMHWNDMPSPDWPLPNVWLGTSVEDQERANQRIPALLATPAAIRWLSCEPLLGPIDLSEWFVCPNWSDDIPMDMTTGLRECCAKCDYTGIAGFSGLPIVDWVVLGGESGPGARPMHPQWARDVRDQCAAAGVPFLFKQHGNFLDIEHIGERWNTMSHAARGRQQFVNGKAMIDVGKKAAGRLLDGVQHDGYPA